VFPDQVEEHPGAVAHEQTTLLQNEEESFALAPVDASALRGISLAEEESFALAPVDASALRGISLVEESFALAPVDASALRGISLV
jgi:hypothetical protein